MRIKDQCVSLEYAKHLCEFGVMQQSYFWWVNIKMNDADVWFHLDNDDPYQDRSDSYSSFTVGELLEMIPHRITIENNPEIAEPFNSFIFRMEKRILADKNNVLTFMYSANYYCDSTECSGENAWLQRMLTNNMQDKNAANCLAKVLIFLYENGCIKND